MTRKRYTVAVTYRACEGFSVMAESPQHAIDLVRNGDPNDPRVPGDREWDEYLDLEAYVVTDDETDQEVARAGEDGQITKEAE